MKIKYVLILLTLTIFLCSNIYASEINETNDDIDHLEVENQIEPLNSNENINQK